MDKWQKISIALAGLLLVACVTLAGVGIWALANYGGGGVLAGLPVQAPTIAATPTSLPTESPVAVPNSRPSTGPLSRLAGAFGIVQTVNGNSVTIAGASATSQTLSITNRTRIIFVGKSDATATDVKPGDKLLALGNKNGNNLEPRAVIVAPPDYDKSNVEIGVVQSISGESVMLKTASGTVSVNADKSAQIFTIDFRQVQLSALKKNDQVVIIGRPNTDGSFTGQLIVARSSPAGANAPAQGGRRQPTPGATPTPEQ